MVSLREITLLIRLMNIMVKLALNEEGHHLKAFQKNHIALKLKMY